MKRLYNMRWTLARRALQLAVLGLFAGTARLGWTLAGEPLLDGTLSASEVAGTIPLSDPLALLERLAAGHMPTLTAGLGALIVLVLYSLLGSRTFCGWICPMNMVADAAEWLRVRLELKADVVRISNKVRYGLLAAALILSAATGTAAFEAVSPQAWIWRDLVFGTGLAALSAASAVFALDLALMKHGWCGHLCPLGAFWSLVGRLTRSPVVRVSFDDAACNRCGDCLRACPEPHVIRFASLKETGRIPAGDCLNCGRCIEACGENALQFRIGGKSIADVSAMSISEFSEWVAHIEDYMDDKEWKIAQEVVKEIRERLRFLMDVGLGYLSLSRSSRSLSGGESQRIKLSSELSKRDTGRTLYILDEPTTGLHFEDIRLLLDVLNKLVDRGNTVIVIEHNLDVIKVADHIIDIGPEGGAAGGEIVAAGTPHEIACAPRSYTGEFLKKLGL